MSLDAHPSEPWIATGGGDGLLVLWECDELRTRSAPRDESVSREFARHLRSYDDARSIRSYRIVDESPLTSPDAAE